MTKLEVHTGNAFLDGHRIFSEGHAGERIPFVLDKALPDYQWQLFANGKPLGRPHDMSEHVASEVRKAVARYLSKDHVALAEPVKARPADEPPAPVLREHGGQIAWNL